MKSHFTLLAAAGAIALAPGIALAAPGQGGGQETHGPQAQSPMAPSSATPSATPNGPHEPSPTTAPGNGQNNGAGYNHMNTGQAKGQPNQSCEELGTTPGNSASAPGGGSPFSGEDSTSGTHYAGSQKQNSRNTASVSQYDTACANQPH